MNFSESVLRTQTMQARLVHNLSAAQADDFVDRIGPEVRRRGDTTLRIHVRIAESNAIKLSLNLLCQDVFA